MRVKKCYTRSEPLLWLTMVLYVVTPFLAKPGWCINNPTIPQTGPGSRHCVPYSGKNPIPHSNLPYLQPWITYSIGILCEISFTAFIKCRRTFRKQSNAQKKSEPIVHCLSIIAVINYV